jgi:hypothetical protein
MMTESELNAAIALLESDMARLQAVHQGVFEFSSAWAERYDTILATTPDNLRPTVEQRLHRIGIRWGVANGARVTGEFPALKV